MSAFAASSQGRGRGTRGAREGHQRGAGGGRLDRHLRHPPQPCHGGSTMARPCLACPKLLVAPSSTPRPLFTPTTSPPLCSVPDLRGCRRHQRESSNHLDRDTIWRGCDTPRETFSLAGTSPPGTRRSQGTAGGAAEASKEPRMRTPNPSPRPDRQPREPAADRPASGGQGRRARPGPPGFTFEVQLVGGEEGRQLEQEQTEAIIEVLAWLAAHPPIATPTASTAKNAGMDAGTRTGRSGSGDAPPSRPMAGRPDQPDRPHSPDDRTRRSRSQRWQCGLVGSRHGKGSAVTGLPAGRVATAMGRRCGGAAGWAARPCGLAVTSARPGPTGAGRNAQPGGAGVADAAAAADDPGHRRQRRCPAGGAAGRGRPAAGRGRRAPGRRRELSRRRLGRLGDDHPAVMPAAPS